MTREMEIKILMEDGCTKKEAQRHIEVGTVVFDDFEKNIDFYCVDLAGGNEDLEEDLRNMAKTRKPIEDWGIVETEDGIYYIMYCL